MYYLYSMKILTRKQVIEELVKIDELILNDDPSYLGSLLIKGFSGYDNYTNEELTEEYNSLYEEEIKIVEYHD